MTSLTGTSHAPRARFAIAVAFFAQGFVFAVVLTHLGAFEDAWDLDDLAITLIMFSVAILAAVGSVLAAALSARWGSATGLRAGVGGLAAAVLVASLAPNLVVFCVGLGIYGLALGCVDATTNMQAVACEALQGRSILTSFHAAWSAGGILGALETSGTAQWSLTASLIVAIVAPAIALAMPFLRAEADSTTTQTVSTEAKIDAVPIPWKMLSVLGCAIVLFYIADSATQSWSTIYLHDVLDATKTIAPLGYAAYQTTSLVSRALGDLLVRRYGPTQVVRLAALVGAVGLALAVTATGPALAIVGFAILGIGIAVVAPLTFAAAGRLADAQPGSDDPRRRRQLADAIVARINQFNYVGFVLGAVLTGLVASGSSMRGGFIVPLVGIIAILPIARAFQAGHAARRVRTTESSS